MIFFPSNTRIPPQKVHFYLLLLPQKVFSLILFSWLHLIRKSSPLSLILFLCFFFLLFLLLHGSLLSHQNKISLSKEEIKGLTLKFQLPSLWVTRTRTQTLKLLLYNLSRLLFSGKGFAICAFDKYKDYFEKYYALKLLIIDITYKHD